MAAKRQYWCRACGCVRAFWFAPMVLCRHNVPDSAHQAREFELLPAWHPLSGGSDV